MNKKTKKVFNNWEKRIRRIVGNAIKGIKTGGNDGSLFIDDLADYLAIINYLKTNSVAEAYDILCDMDTAATDEIPESVYNYILIKNEN